MNASNEYREGLLVGFGELVVMSPSDD